MNFKLLLCIAMGVFVAHLAVFMMMMRFRLNQLPPPAPKPVQNFGVAEAVVVDPQTGEKTVHREFRVSTRLVERDDAPPPRKP